MPCYMCKTKTGPFQMLEVARLRFIRKAQPDFKDNSYLCPKCFSKFERIYKSKSRKNDSTSSRINILNSSIRSVSTNTHSTRNSSRNKSNVIAIQRADRNNNGSSDIHSSVIHFDSHSMESPSSIDSTDRIVRMVPNFLSLRDSSRKTTTNPQLNVARQGAEAAVRSALKRQRTLQADKAQSAALTRRDALEIAAEETSEDEDIASQLSPNDLAHVRPVVRRRKEPVVQQFGDVMDIYISRTSGG